MHTHLGLAAYTSATTVLVLLLARERITTTPTWVIARGILRGRWHRLRRALIRHG